MEGVSCPCRKFLVHDDCTESSIYWEGCGGKKDQKPLSYRIGQYETHMHGQFSVAGQLVVKRKLMKLLDEFIRLAEAEVRREMPQAYALQAEL